MRERKTPASVSQPALEKPQKIADAKGFQRRGATYCLRALREAMAGMGESQMLSDHTLAMLRCPNDRSTLRLADLALLTRLNAAIVANRVRNQTGHRVERPIDGGLIRAAGDLLYPIVDQIPVMLFDEAIPLGQLEGV